jgi:hypothetical protein
VLHGRAADQASGCYTDREDFDGRLRLLRQDR